MLKDLRDSRTGVPHLDGGYCAPYLYLLDEDAPAPSRSKSYTQRRLEHVQRAVKAGRGLGRGEAYQPWIRITRGFSSPVGYQVFGALSVHQRNHHFISKLEYDTSLVFAYLGATEVRECLPMWPKPHPHPWLQDAGDVPGLLDIAHDVGIDHGTFVGTTVPYVGSLDMLFQMPWRGGAVHVGVSCKPDGIYDASPRARERVELDRMYCGRVGARHMREGGPGLNKTLIKNLADFRPLRSELVALEHTDCLSDFCEEFAEAARHKVLTHAITEAGRRLGLTHSTAGLLWRIGVWRHQIDIDLTLPVQMCRPIRSGGDQVRAALEEHFLGGAQ